MHARHQNREAMLLQEVQLRGRGWGDRRAVRLANAFPRYRAVLWSICVLPLQGISAATGCRAVILARICPGFRAIPKFRTITGTPYRRYNHRFRPILIDQPQDRVPVHIRACPELLQVVIFENGRLGEGIADVNYQVNWLLVVSAALRALWLTALRALVVSCWFIGGCAPSVVGLFGADAPHG